MDLHRKELIKRFVILGAKSNQKPDYIYYGDEYEGLWAKSNDVLKLLLSKKSKSAVPVGKLTFQAWNRAIKKNSKSEKKRGVIQLKWGTVGEDLKKIFYEKNE